MKESLMKKLAKQETWQAYFLEKEKSEALTENELSELKEFLETKAYEAVVGTEEEGKFSFRLPEKHLINKMGSQKKRTVYMFPQPENQVLKVLVWLLREYDYAMPDCCYAFRKNKGAGTAIRTLLRTDSLNQKYSCKVDIKDYFNSIPIDLLLPKLKLLFNEDELLFSCMEKLLTADQSVCDGKVITEKRGAMAGSPLAGFLANVYLMDLDFWFLKRGIAYARYSDDIIFFADSLEEREEYCGVIYAALDSGKLKINPSKVQMTNPGERWEYLGISYNQGEIDLSQAAIEKMKGKIRRKARALYRWKCRNQVESERAIRVMNRVFEQKFFHNPVRSEMTWTRWFFPLITTDKGLNEIDSYMQQYLRYLHTGRHCKKNYEISYKQLKDLGYRSLVHEYYAYRNLEK